MDHTFDLTVRPARISDGDAIAGLFGAAWAASLSMVPKMHSAEEDRIYFASLIREQEVYVIDEAGTSAGFIALTPGWINHLYVHPEHQGRGIGATLLSHAKSLQPELTLWTFQANANARAFYERHGFTPVEFTDGSANEERTPDVRYYWAASSADAAIQANVGSQCVER